MASWDMYPDSAVDYLLREGPPWLEGQHCGSLASHVPHKHEDDYWCPGTRHSMRPETGGEQECPHGYEYGDHHWYACMGVNPRTGEKKERPWT